MSRRSSRLLRCLEDARTDLNCWTGEIFPLLLASLESQGVKAKRDLWTQFWPVFKETVKVKNTNKYSIKSIYSIAKSMEQLRSEGISEEDTEEIIEFISYEVEALKERRMVGEKEYDEDWKVCSIEWTEWIERDEEWMKYEPEAMILGSSFCTKDLGLPEDEGVEKP
ncbi:hypothetical protein PENTCL1PPCAC_26679 [Pristionchus entomophagus]|uniref:Uncharacterized protein n=1 Tax=Pristionchus entomophagus TaxID=358040 RepID=A0AAV5UC56_9BILA|nr:hypothetical protein PENTCL1PPCAC_26679 [Pristionchus entomophagus]